MNEYVIFSLQRKNNSDVLFERQFEPLKYQKDILENEEISFYYFFKDLKVAIEEELYPKLKVHDSTNAVNIVVRYADKILYESELDIKTLNKDDVTNNEMEIYLFFEKVCKDFEKKIMDEHKNIVL